MYDFEGASRFLLEEHWNIVVPKPSTSWTYARDYCRDVGHPEAWDWLWKEGVDAGLFRHGHVMKGAFRFVHTLAKEGHELVVITSRPRRAAADTLEWLGFHRMPVTEVHVLGPGKKKSAVMPRADLYLDDAPHNIDDILYDTQATAVLWDAKWNQDYQYPDLLGRGSERFRRAYAWNDVHNAIDYLERERTNA